MIKKPLQSTLKVHWPINQSGISLVEVMLASAIFMIITVMFVSAIISAQQATLKAETRSRALLVANEGLEAVRNMRDENFSLLTNGTYGLSLQNNEWTTSANPDITDIFSRSVTISTIDANTKLVTSDVSWNVNAANNGNVSLKSYLANWKSVLSTQADAIMVDISGANLSGDNKELRGITIQNTDQQNSSTITKITGSWSNTSSNIERIRLDTTTVWSLNGPGTPIGSQPSGTQLDIQDFAIAAGNTASADNFKFSQPMPTSSFTFILIFGDGSQKTFSVF